MGERVTTKMESQLYLGKNRLRANREPVRGQRVILEGEDFYQIANYDRQIPSSCGKSWCSILPIRFRIAREFIARRPLCLIANASATMGMLSQRLHWSYPRENSKMFMASPDHGGE